MTDEPPHSVGYRWNLDTCCGVLDVSEIERQQSGVSTRSPLCGWIGEYETALHVALLASIVAPLGCSRPDKAAGRLWELL